MKYSNYIVLIIAASMLFSCKSSDDQILPGAEVNYFSAAEGIFCFTGFKPFYVDHVDTTLAEPNEFTTRTPTGETFPALNTAGPAGTSLVLHVKEAPGNHRFVFTNAKKHTVADTTFDLAPGVKHYLYVYDDPDNMLKHCRVLHLVEEGPAAADECRFRLLHLSSDLGLLNCYFIMEDGSRSFPASLPVDFTYGKYSDYIKLDESVVGKDGNAYLQFFNGTDTATVRATATLPFRKGRSYAVVVSGLINNKFVPYQDPVDPTKVVSVQLNASISARVRTIN